MSGSKNAALPILAATLLTDEPCVIRNVPRLRDIDTMARLLTRLGKDVRHSDDGSVRVSRAARRGRALHEAPYDLVKTMRASVVVLGPLLARYGRASAALPGGCAIGPRPIDIHLRGLAALGGVVSMKHGDVILR